MESAKKRSARTTAEQRKIMLDFFESSRGLAEGRFASIHGRQEACKKWEELAAHLNAVNGAEKTASQWQVTWRDLKSRVSVKARERRKERAKTGGKPLTLPALTELDMRVLHIIGHNYVGGSSICPDSFPEEEDLQILLESGRTEVIYQNPTVPTIFEVQGGDEVVQVEGNWPVEELDNISEEPAQPRSAHTKVAQTPKRRLPKRTQMDFAREQFSEIAQKQADAIMIQAESAKRQAEALQQLANSFDRIASALERLAISVENSFK